jgi:crotonobetainyl-CoA:carnitine CoA-transferase CaiB-like acyl-CoA transferase
MVELLRYETIPVGQVVGPFAYVVPLLEAHLKRHDAAHWGELLEKHGAAVAPIQTLDQVLAHPQVLAKAMVVAADGANSLRRA